MISLFAIKKSKIIKHFKEDIYFRSLNMKSWRSLGKSGKSNLDKKSKLMMIKINR
jgi:hypothetical protein